MVEVVGCVTYLVVARAKVGGSWEDGIYLPSKQGAEIGTLPYLRPDTR